MKKTISATIAATIMMGALAAPAATFASSAKPVTVAPFVNAAKPVAVAVADTPVETQNIISNIIKKAITSALRYGGDYLGKLIGKLSPSAGSFVTKYSGKIADVLDSITNWQENVIASGLVSIGIPPAEAYEIATAIVWVAGL